jgi:hypothetical protein
MDRRVFLSSCATVGAGAAIASLACAEAAEAKSASGNPNIEPTWDLARLGRAATRQLTTFNLGRKSKTIPVPRGKKVTVGQVAGAGCITQFWLTFPGWFWQHWNTKAPISQSILKTLILRVFWDGAAAPAVAAPVGDFFGAGLCEVASFASLYFGASSGGFFCKFPMPFRKGFRLEIENLDAELDTEVFCNVLFQSCADVPADLGYFHAQFNTGHNEGPAPVKIAEATGRGHYSGCLLYMQGKERNYLSFLEAPEYVYVDDDWDTPRIVGTGLEDYFLGGWYFREGVFSGPYHGLPIKDALNASVAMYRVHETDAIHFQRRLKFDFVNPWAPERLRPFCYSSVAFLYLDTPEGQGRSLPAAKDLLCWYRVRNTDHQSIP